MAIPADYTNNKPVDTLINSSVTLSKQIEENYTFYGLASYYNNPNYYIVSSDALRKISSGDVIKLGENQWLAVVARLNVLLIQSIGLSVHLNESKLIVDNSEMSNQSDTTVRVVSKSELSLIAPELDQIRYAHLWDAFAWLAKVVESSLVTIQSHITSSWGLTIVIFSILLKLLLLPVGVMTVRFQRKASQVQAQLTPQLTKIKASYDGEEAHNRLMAAYKDLGISPFYTLKPMLGSFIQIPILIAVFNALGEMPQLDNQSFLWIKNLAYPDAITQLPFNIPMFGRTFNLLPFIMTAVTLFSTVIFQNSCAHEQELRRQKRNLYLMATMFFILFYPFPAAMVLFWTINNILHTVQQQIIRI